MVGRMWWTDEYLDGWTGDWVYYLAAQCSSNTQSVSQARIFSVMLAAILRQKLQTQCSAVYTDSRPASPSAEPLMTSVWWVASRLLIVTDIMWSWCEAWSSCFARLVNSAINMLWRINSCWSIPFRTTQPNSEKYATLEVLPLMCSYWSGSLVFVFFDGKTAMKVAF